MKKVINGLAVFLEGDKSAPPILFVHGFPYDHSMWKVQIEEFSKDHFCISYDIRGLGESLPGDGQYTMESFVDDLEIIMDELNLEQPVLCGLSMGGYISLRALERMPEKFSAVILCDTRAEADNNEGKLKRAAAIKRINLEGLAPYLQDFMITCFSDYYKKNHQEDLQAIIQKSSRFDTLGVKGCLIAMLSRTDTVGALEKIEMPILLIFGEEDALTPPADMRAVFQKIEQGEFVEISRAGHMSPIENPIDVNKAIREFLKKL
jgi:3-oxoadipate enol-lactonase